MISLSQFKKFKEFLGPEVLSYLIKSVFVGLFLFAVESSFVFIVQGFLFSIQILEESQLILPAWYPRSLFWSLMLLVLFSVLRGVAYLFKSYLGGMTGETFKKLQRTRILTYGLTHAGRLSPHELINAFTERVSQAGSVLNGLSQMIVTATAMFFLLGLGLRLAPLELILGLLILACFLLPLRLFNKKVLESGEGVLRESKTSDQILLQGIRHYFFLKVYGLIPLEIQKGVQSLIAYENHFKKFHWIQAIKSSLPLVLGVFTISFIAFVSIRYIHTPAIKLLGFYYIFVRIAQSIGEMNSTYAVIVHQIPGLKNLYSWHLKRSLSDLKNDSRKSETNLLAEKEFLNKVHAHRIEMNLDNVSFGYEGSPDLFSNINEKLTQGDVFLIRGASGVGKSTLLTLMTGMNRPTHGSVKVNGFDVGDIQSCLSPVISYVGPEPYLIPGTVRENLLYGSPHAQMVQDQDLWDALRRAKIELLVKGFENGLDEYLYDYTQISTGQKQRISLARAYIRNPKILILDEATANLDEKTEESILHSLAEVTDQIILIIISHKNSFDKIATHRLHMG